MASTKAEALGIIETGTKVFQTKNYDIFKTLEGNRDVRDKRVDKIIKSIRSVGYVMNPIIVNENHEVIDGQGRLEALKRLQLPVYYLIADGAGIDECIAMNVNQTNWTMSDYVLSFVDQGKEDYIRLAQLASEYPQFDFRTLIVACMGLSCGGNANNVVINGLFTLSEFQMRTARERLTYMARFQPYVSKMRGHKSTFYTALVWCMKNLTFDRERLVRKFSENYATQPPIANIESSLMMIENIYNFQLQGKDRIYYVSEWDRLKRDKK